MSQNIRLNEGQLFSCPLIILAQLSSTWQLLTSCLEEKHLGRDNHQLHLNQRPRMYNPVFYLATSKLLAPVKSWAASLYKSSPRTLKIMFLTGALAQFSRKLPDYGQVNADNCLMLSLTHPHSHSYLQMACQDSLPRKEVSSQRCSLPSWQQAAILNAAS